MLFISSIVADYLVKISPTATATATVAACCSKK